MLSAPPLTQILVVRHSEVHNPKDILYGRLPRFGLSVKGREQAEQTARFLAGRPVTAIYTSPLLRARQTARILTHYHPSVPVHMTRDLLEVRTSYQGSPNSILKPGFSFFEPRKNEDDEMMAEVWNRFLRLLRRIVRLHGAQCVVAVSHADPIAVMRIGLEGKELTAANMHATVYPARSSITQLTFTTDGRLAVEYFNVAEVTELKL
jgi:broad specificity phosphatase PhoE